jgi:hypothetical protein
MVGTNGGKDLASTNENDVAGTNNGTKEMIW